VPRGGSQAAGGLPAMLQNRTPASWLAGDSLLSRASTRAAACAGGDHGESQGGRSGGEAPHQAQDPRDLPTVGRAEPPTTLGSRGARSASGATSGLPGPGEGPAEPSAALGAVPPGTVVTRPVAGLLVHYKRWISPLLPRACRFTPTCSEYARLAILQYGLLRGGARALWRLLRCHPFHPGGVDLP
jgi:putative membrane protein insertion efficiency factor